MADWNLQDLGNIIGGGLKDAQNYKEDFIPTEETSSITLAGVSAVAVDSTLLVYSKTLGNAWIVGSLGNGKVGTNIDTQNGQQQVVGGANRIRTLLYTIIG